jgi:hypothetical protein
MPRTTVDIEAPILEEVRALQKQERRSMGSIISQLLAEALSHRATGREAPSFEWQSQPMRPLIDLADKEAVYAIQAEPA